MAKWYCPLPDNSISADTQGNWNLCCEAESDKDHTVYTHSPKEWLESELMQSVRTAFKGPNPLRNPKIKQACQACWKKEEEGILSKRQKEIQALSQIGDATFFEAKMIGNICNLKCMTCGPDSSSGIAEEQGVAHIFSRYQTLPDSFYEDLPEVASKYSKINFSGGEPFMSPTCKKMLKILIDSGVSKNLIVTFNTNGYVKADKLIHIIENFKTTGLAVSIDAYGERNNFVRRGSDWDILSARLFEYSALAKYYPVHEVKGFNFCLNPVISALNIGYMDELQEFYKQFSNYTDGRPHVTDNLNFVGGDSTWAAVNLPDQIKDIYKNKIQHCPKEWDKILSSRNPNNRDRQLIKMIQEVPGLKKSDWERFYPEFMEFLSDESMRYLDENYFSTTNN